MMQSIKWPNVVHGAMRAQALPLLHRVGRRWCILHPETARQPGTSNSQGTDPLDLLSDLAHYGMPLPLAQVSSGMLLWWPSQPAPADELQVPVQADSRFTQLAGPVSCIEWTPEVPATDRWRYGVSAAARSMAASAHLPVVHQELLSVAAAFQGLPQGNICLCLGRVDHAPFAWLWRRRTWEAIEQRTLLLRERRRLALGLPARHDAAELDALIESHFVLPIAQHWLDGIDSQAQHRLHVLSTSQRAGIDAPQRTIDVRVGCYLSDDPLGDNLYVLGARRLRSSTALAPHLRSTGRGVAKLAHRMQTRALVRQAVPAPEWGAAMLAALQLDYLYNHRTARKLL